jgi:hypothetical protein
VRIVIFFRSLSGKAITKCLKHTGCQRTKKKEILV